MNLVILDRDGVINEDSNAYIKSEDEWVPIPGSLDAIARLTRAGYRVAVATNQSGLARGLFDEFALARIHQKMCNAVEDAGGRIAGIFYCPHGPDAGCGCRKPARGLLDEIASEFKSTLDNVPLVGDSLKDLQVALVSGCRPLLVRTGKGEQTLADLDEELTGKIAVVADLSQAADFIIAGE